MTLEKQSAPGAWGFLVDDDALVYGPRDTWGHNGAELPYYASGGSTATDAPSNLINTGEGETDIERTAGGGPPGARVFNKHGDTIPGSVRGEHMDYWADRVVTVKTYPVGNGAAGITIDLTLLERSQGSPPSPM